jgi:hypothetical protein
MPARMRVRLTRKLAEMIDGIDLSAHKEGDLLNLPEPEGRLLVAEQWGIEERRAVDRGENPRQFVSRSSQQAGFSSTRHRHRS